MSLTFYLGAIFFPPMPVITRKVSSLTDFINQVISLRDQWTAEERKRAKEAEDQGDHYDNEPLPIWFRGQANARWKLVPKLYRMADSNESEIRTEFRQRGLQLISEGQVPRDDKEWYFLMQHFGAPTRLLDWTDGALIALYFAVKEQNRYANGSVWMLDAGWFNDAVLNDHNPDNYISGVILPEWPEFADWFPTPFSQNLNVAYPVAVDPPHVARRVSVQRSRFTIHGKDRIGLDVIANGLPRTRLAKMLIPNQVGKEILKNLQTCGIVETSVFPDLEGLSRELLTKWTKIKHGQS